MKSRIGKRMFLYFSLGSMILVACFTWIFYDYFGHFYRDRFEANEISAIQGAADTFNTFLTEIWQNSYYLCVNNDLAEDLTDSGENTAIRQRAQIGSTFALITGAPSSRLMESTYTYLLIDGQFPLAGQISGFHSRGTVLREHVYSAADILEDPWYQETVAQKGQIFPWTDSSDGTHVYFSHVLKSTVIADPRYNETLGVVVYSVSRYSLRSVLEDLHLTDGTAACFLYNGTVLAGTSEDLFPEGDSESASAILDQLAGYSGTIRKITFQSVPYLACKITIRQNFECLVMVPVGEIAIFGGAPVYILLADILLALLVIFIISLLLSRQILRPVTSLSGIMKQSSSTKRLLTAPPFPRDDEIGELYRSYNAMTDEIVHLFEAEQQKAEQLRRSELNALQAQINPHFIYNTLDSVSCSALLEGNDNIVTMVSSLVSILKYSMHFTSSTVCLKEELNYLEDYLRIQHLRYEQGFTFSCEIPEKYDRIVISRIILQPLVENALFHAQREDRTLVIRLTCEEDGTDFLIHVSDNGSSADAEALNRLLQSKTGPEGGKSIGIRNVNRRIRLRAGDRYGLFYRNLPDGGLDSIVRIPLEYAAPAGSGTA